MSYKTILVHLDDRARRAERLQVGLHLASSFEAHLVGLFALDAAYIPSYALAEGGPMMQEIERRRRKKASSGKPSAALAARPSGVSRWTARSPR